MDLLERQIEAAFIERAKIDARIEILKLRYSQPDVGKRDLISHVDFAHEVEKTTETVLAALDKYEIETFRKHDKARIRWFRREDGDELRRKKGW